jgi:endonuclease III
LNSVHSTAPVVASLSSVTTSPSATIRSALCASAKFARNAHHTRTTSNPRKPTIGQAPSARNISPAARLTTATIDITVMNPVRDRDRCGVSVMLQFCDLLMSVNYAKTASLDQTHFIMPKSLKPAAIAELFRRFQAANPDPRGELHSLNPFTFLVAVVLSAQATDESVNKATGPLFALAPTPEQMLDLGEARVTDMIRTIGLFRGKARNVIALSRILVDHHGSQVPRDREALEALPGVGRKTANVVLNNVFGETTIAVDTHLFRLGNRLGLAPGKTPLEVELKLLKRVPAAFRRHAHHWLILHGRYICKARKPECWRCAVADLCPHKPKTPAPA